MATCHRSLWVWDTFYHFLCACWCLPWLQACSGKILTLGESHLSRLLSTVWESKVPSVMRLWTNKIIYCEMLLKKDINIFLSLCSLSLSLRHAKIHLHIAYKEYILWILSQCNLGTVTFLFMLNDKLNNLWHCFVLFSSQNWMLALCWENLGAP